MFERTTFSRQPPEPREPTAAVSWKKKRKLEGANDVLMYNKTGITLPMCVCGDVCLHRTFLSRSGRPARVADHRPAPLALSANSRGYRALLRLTGRTGPELL